MALTLLMDLPELGHLGRREIVPWLNRDPVRHTAKTAARCGALRAIREAVGQLFEYRRFLGPREAQLCILLDEDPGEVLERYVEEDLGLLIVWTSERGLVGGHESALRLPSLLPAIRP